MKEHCEKILITAPDPAADIVSLDDMKAHLRYEDTDQDTLIQSLIDAAIGMIDPAAGGSLGRALRPQTWELQLRAFPCKACYPKQTIELPYPPLISVTSFKYDDMAGVEQTLVENTDFFVFGKGGRGKQYIEPAYGTRWPISRCSNESVRVRFQSGYAVPEDSDPDTLPESIKAWLKLEVEDLFANRAASQIVRGTQFENPSLARLLDPYRVF